MEKISEEQINQLFLDPLNRSCFECGGHVTHWVSANNAIYLCLSCAGIHRGFGPDISFVRSLKMDSWTPSQFEAMKKGGNAKLREYFTTHNISCHIADVMDAKYRTDEAHHYRDQLKTPGEPKPFPGSPSRQKQVESPIKIKEEAFIQDHNDHCSEQNHEDLAEPNVVVEDSLQEDIESPKPKANPSKLANSFQLGFKKFGASVAGGAKTVATGTKVAATKINQKMKESQIKEEAKVFGNKVADAAKKSYVGAIGYFKKLSTKKKPVKEEEEVCDTTCDESQDPSQIQNQINQYRKALEMYNQEKPSLSL